MNAPAKRCGKSLRQSNRRQAGASLLIALINEKSARNDHDRHIAFEAAEAALRDAELLLPGLATDQSDLDLAQAAAPWFEYGHFSGQHFPHGAASLSRQPPCYQIELLDVRAPALDADTGMQPRYRINAIGFGSRAGTQVRLQTIHAIRDGQPPIRLSWREINQ